MCMTPFPYSLLCAKALILEIIHHILNFYTDHFLFCGIRNVPSSCRLHIIISKKTFRVILMLFSELKCKDVINLRNCQKLGKVSDLEFDECSGQIRKLFVPNGNKFLNFLCCEPDYCIPYKDIRQIGPDIIIVDIKC